MCPEKPRGLGGEFLARGFLCPSDLLDEKPTSRPLGRNRLLLSSLNNESTMVEAAKTPRLTDGEIQALIGRDFHHYRATAFLERGSVSAVYRGDHPQRDHDIAIKVIPLKEWSAPMIFQFVREVHTLTALDHPGIIPILESGIDNDYLFIVMPLIDGHSLERELALKVRLPEATVIPWAKQLLAALGHAHHQGVIHRDLKPANVLIDQESRVRIIDFGLALNLSSDEETQPVVGTPPYIAPEVWKGASCDERSDLYSLGVIVYRMLTGEPPFSGANPAEIRKAHLQHTPPLAHEVVPEISPSLGEALARMLSKDPAHRFQSAQAFLRAMA